MTVSTSVKCHYAECSIFIVMLNVITLSVFMPNVLLLNVVAPDKRYRSSKSRVQRGSHFKGGKHSVVATSSLQGLCNYKSFIYIKHFTAAMIDVLSQKVRVSVTVSHFHRLIFAGKDRAYQSGATYGSPHKGLAPGLPRKYFTCVVMNNSDKHSSFKR